MGKFNILIVLIPFCAGPPRGKPGGWSGDQEVWQSLPTFSAEEGYRRFSEALSRPGRCSSQNTHQVAQNTCPRGSSTKRASERRSGSFLETQAKGKPDFLLACIFLPSMDISGLEQNVKVRDLTIGQMLHLISMHSTNRSYGSQLPSDKKHFQF